MSGNADSVMTGDRAERGPATPPYHDTWAKTYRYLRTALVGLLICLGLAVAYQTWRQGWHLLSSVSAYYYTPAQAIFVGALIGLGACMIALKGTTGVEDVFLNLGGMFAAVVAIVPTARNQDYTTAIRACTRAAGPLLTHKAGRGRGPDCPDVVGLAEATRANVQNNMTALLALGFLGLLATVLFFVLRDRRLYQRDGRSTAKFWWGFGSAVVLFVLGATVFVTSVDWFIGHAHYIGAVGLFGCIFVVAVENARRRRVERAGAARDGQRPSPYGASVATGRRDHYVWIAWAMVVAAAVGTVLLAFAYITLFWLEIAVALLFAVFWMVQTVEQLSD